jgi:YgiT-type zinc finger domain-containing protein
VTAPGQLEYGLCACGGHFEQRYVEIRMTVDGSPTVVTDVPQGACPLCGSRVYKAALLEEIERTMRGAQSPPAPSP